LKVQFTPPLELGLNLILHNCLKNSIDCFVKQSIVFLELVKTVIQNASFDFNDFSNLLLIQKTLMELILD